jgi:hypothetical protein
VATVNRAGDLIAKAEVSATVTLPDATIVPLELRDDGIAPDAEADDGYYSAIMAYDQPGEHIIDANFGNAANLAEYTFTSRHFTPDPDGNTHEPAPIPVGEDFTASSRLHVQVSGFQMGFAGQSPTEISLDNRDYPGRIDEPGHVGRFTFAAEESREIAVRITDLALDMTPRARLSIYRDGVPELLLEIDPVADADTYAWAKVSVEAGEQYLLEVEHIDPGASGGLFNVSAGEPLANTFEALPDTAPTATPTDDPIEPTEPVVPTETPTQEPGPTGTVTVTATASSTEPAVPTEQGTPNTDSGAIYLPLTLRSSVLLHTHESKEGVGVNGRGLKLKAEVEVARSGERTLEANQRARRTTRICRCLARHTTDHHGAASTFGASHTIDVPSCSNRPARVRSAYSFWNVRRCAASESRGFEVDFTSIGIS